MDFPAKIKKLRKVLNITQTNLARHCGVSQTVISHWEHGLHIAAGKQLTKLQRLCEKHNLAIKFKE